MNLRNLIVLFLSIACFTNCTNRNDFTAESPDFFLDARETGFANWFISKDSALHMKHYFEMWHRNRQFFDENGKQLRTVSDYDTSGDVIVGIDQMQTPHNDSLSKSVWFEKDVIIKMAEILNTPKFKCDGMRVYFAAYNRLDSLSIPGQMNAHQATVFFVPTTMHKDNFEIVEDLKAVIKTSDGGAYNHGELCPKVCN